MKSVALLTLLILLAGCGDTQSPSQNAPTSDAGSPAATPVASASPAASAEPTPAEVQHAVDHIWLSSLKPGERVEIEWDERTKTSQIHVLLTFVDTPAQTLTVSMTPAGLPKGIPGVESTPAISKEYPFGGAERATLDQALETVWNQKGPGHCETEIQLNLRHFAAGAKEPDRTEFLTDTTCKLLNDFRSKHFGGMAGMSVSGSK